jgi:proline iminopeptidase
MSEGLVTLSDGARVWTSRSGSGVPTVLLNGGPGMADYLAPVSDLLGDVCETLRFEARGCGRSARTVRTGCAGSSPTSTSCGP